jgi:hypothetical protein
MQRSSPSPAASASTASAPLYVSGGNRIDHINAAGRTTVSYRLEGHGWATVKAAADGRHLHVGNLLSGQLPKLEPDSGELIASADTGVERSRLNDWEGVAPWVRGLNLAFGRYFLDWSMLAKPSVSES